MEPQDRRIIVEAGNEVLVETSYLIPKPKRRSLLQGISSPLIDFTGNTFDDKYIAGDILQHVRDYTAILDFILVEEVK